MGQELIAELNSLEVELYVDRERAETCPLKITTVALKERAGCVLGPTLPDCLCDAILEVFDLARHLVPDHAQSIAVDHVEACVWHWWQDHVSDATRREGEPPRRADDLLGGGVDVVARVTDIDLL